MPTRPLLLHEYPRRKLRAPVTTPDAPFAVQGSIPNGHHKKPSGHSGMAHSPTTHPQPKPIPRAGDLPSGHSDTAPSLLEHRAETTRRHIPYPAANHHGSPDLQLPEYPGSHSCKPPHEIVAGRAVAPRSPDRPPARVAAIAKTQDWNRTTEATVHCRVLV